jgi:alcohol dehydrogenase class IV
VVQRIDEIVQHVPVENADRATTDAVAGGIDAIVTIGGGSSTGLAKAVALKTGIPIVAIPTTFAGSEATDVWGMTEGRRKTTGVDPRVLPYVTAFNAPFAPDAAERIQALLGVASAAAGLSELRSELGAPASLAAIGLKESDIPQAAELALPAVPPSNPRPVTVSDLEGIMRAAWVGEQIV